MKRKLIQLAFILTGIPAIGFAQPVISVDPGSFNVNLNCGDTTTQGLTIYNTGTDTLFFVSFYPYCYIGNSNGSDVTVLDMTSNAMTGSSINVSGWPYLLAMTPDNQYVYVADYDNIVSVIRTLDNTLVSSIPVGNYPYGIDITPDGSHAYVTCKDDNSVMVIDCGTNTVVDTISQNLSAPRGIKITPDGKYAYVANEGGGVTVIEISTNTSIAFIGGITFGHQIAITPDGKYVYVSDADNNWNWGFIHVISTKTNTIINTIPGNGGSPHPKGLDVTPDGKYVYVADSDGRIYVIEVSTQTIINTITDPGLNGPWALRISPDGRYAFVTDRWDATSLAVIDISTNTVIDNFYSGDGSRGITTPKKYPSWLSLNPSLDYVLAGDSLKIDVFFDASGVPAGTYTYDLTIYSNDTTNSLILVPCSLTVSGNPVLVLSDTCLDYDTVMEGGIYPLSLWIINTGCDTLFVTSMTTSTSDFSPDTNALAVLPYSSEEVIVYFTPSTTGTLTDTLEIFSNGGDTTICLSGFGIDAPHISLNPESFNVVFNNCDDTASFPLTIYNTGAINLDFDITTMTYSPPFNFAYIANRSDNTVTVLDVTTNTLVGAPISVGALPWRVTIKPDARYVYVSNRDGNSISVIRTSDNTVTTTIPVGNRPTGLAFTPDGNYAYVGNRNSDNVMKIDCGTNTVVNTITTSISEPQDIAITPDGKYAYVANAGSGIIVIEVGPDTVVATIGGTWLGDHFIDITPDGQYVYVSRSWNDDVIVISTATNSIVATIGGFDEPHGLDITPDGNFVYVLDKWNEQVDIIDVNTNSIVYSINDSRFDNGWGLAISPYGDYAYVTNAWNTPSLIIIDISTNTIVDAFSPGNDPRGIATLFGGLPWLDASITSGSITPGDSTTLNILFDGIDLNAGTYTGDIIINSNDPLSPAAIPCTLTVIGTPEIVLSDTCLNFDTTFQFGTSTETLRIYNTDCGNLSVTDIISMVGEFSVDTTTFIVLPDDSVDVIISFSPLSTGSFSGTLNIFNNDMDTTVCLSGEAIFPPIISFIPDSYNITTPCNTLVTDTLVIYNTGADNLLFDLIPCNLNGSLDNILVALNQNFTPVINAIPSRYNFSDGVTGTYINDGGGDMYDGGNYLRTNIGGSFNYSDNLVVSNTWLGSTGKYFTRKYTGLFVFGADINGVDWFEISGNLGADGSGSSDASILTVDMCGTTYKGFVKRVYNAGDPSVNHLIIVEDKPGIDHNWSSNTDDDQHMVFNLATTTRLYHLLYASSGGGYIDDNATLNIMSEFLNAINIFPDWLSLSPESDTIIPGDSTVVDVQFNTTGYTVGQYSTNIFVSSNDPVNPLDTIPVVLTVTGASEITISDTCLYLDSIMEFTTNSESFWILNTGCDTLFITDANNSLPEFSLSDTAGYIMPGDSTEIIVTFAPVSAGFFMDNINIFSNDVDTSLCLYGYAYLSPSISFNPDSFDVFVACGDSLIDSLTIYNTGLNELNWNIGFSVIIGGISVDSLSGVIAAGDSTTVYVDFNASGMNVGTYATDIIINSNDPLNPLVTVPILMNVTGTPEITVSDSCLYLDSIMQYTINTNSFWILNTGCDTLFFTDANNSIPEFSLSDTAGYIMPGGSTEIIVTFTPVSVGFFQDTINIFSNDVDTSVCLFGYAYPSASISFNPDTFDVTINSCCDSTILPLTIYNTGGSDLIYTASSGSGSGGGSLMTYSETYTNGASYCPGSPQFDNWVSFRSQLDTNLNKFTSVTIKGSNDMTGRTCTDPVKVMQMAGSLRNSVAGTWAGCDGYTWIVAMGCGSGCGAPASQIVEFNANGTTCNCASPGYDLRPAIANNNWGGINSTSCGAPTQTMIVEFEYISWLTLSQTGEDTIAPGDSAIVDVTFKSCDLNAGTYTSTIEVTSNDPMNSPYTIPVTFTIDAPPQIILSDTCLYLDSIMEFITNSESFWILNTGCDTLFITDANNSLPEFSLSDTAGYIMPGDSVEIIVTFAPTSAGFFQDTVNILSNDVDTSVCLFGYAFLSPAISYDPDSFDVTIAGCCDSSTYPLTIYNTGGADLDWTISISSGIADDFDPGIDLSQWTGLTGWASANCGSVSGNALYFDDNGIRQAETIDLNVVGVSTVDFYLKIATGSAPCENADAGEDVVLEYSTNGGGSWTIINTYLESVYPNFTLINEPIPAPAKTTSTRFRWRQLFHSGNCCDHWAIDNISIGSTVVYLTVDPDTGTIIPGDSTIINVQFNTCGLTTGTYFSDIVINSNDPLSPQEIIPAVFTVQGVPEIILSDTCLYLDSIMEFTTNSSTLLISNNGCDTLFVSNITNTLPEYSVDITSFTLLPGGSQPVVVTFAPTSVGFFQDTIVIYNNDADTTVCLSGYGYVMPEISVDPASFSDTIAYCVDSITFPMTIYNTGGSDLIFDIDTGGYYATFDGVNDYIRVSNNYSGLSVVTLETWIYPTNTTGLHWILSNARDCCTPTGGFNFYMNGTNLQGSVWRSTSSTLISVSAGGVLSINTWQHVALVYDGTKIELFLNGNLVATSAISGLSAVQNGSQNLHMGVLAFSAPSYYDYQGYMDNVRIWNIVRNQSEINANMNIGLSGNEPGLISYWDFDDQTANDQSPNGNDGTFFGNATTTIGGPFTDLFTGSLITNTVPAGDSSVVDVFIDMSSLNSGLYVDTIEINSNDPLNSPVIVPILIDYIGAPEIALSDTCINSDTIFQWASTTDSLYIGNTGCDTLFVTDIVSSSAEFTVDITTLPIMPGDSSLVIITFSPVTPGSYSETLTIFNNDIDTTICLTGFALSPPIISYNPDSFNVLFTTCADSVTLPLTVYNSGTEDLIFDVGNGYSTSLDGVNSHVDCGNNAIFQIPQGTIEAWFRTNSTSVQFAAGVPYDDGSAWDNPWVGFQIGTSSNQGRFWLNVNGSDVEFDAGTINTGEWYHVTLTYDGAIARGYINGVQVGTQNVAGSITYSGTPSFVIGNRSIQAPGERFNGLIDEVRLWNTARSQTEIFATMNQRLAGDESGLIGYWNFDDQTANDLTVNGNDGTFAGNAIPTVPNAPVAEWLSFALVPDTVVTGDSTIIDINFYSNGLITGIYTSEIFINSNDPLSSLDTIHCTLEVQGYPVIASSDTCLDLDSIMQYTSNSASVTVYNNGCDTLFVDSITNSLGAYSIDTSAFLLLPGDSLDIVVTFSPITAGTFNDTLTVYNNDTVMFVCLTGISYPPPLIVVDPDTLDTTITSCLDSLILPLTIYNNGGSDLIFDIDTGGYLAFFDGNGDYIQFSNSTVFDISNLTIEAWVYSSNYNQNGFIFEKGPVNTQYSLFFEGASLCFRTYNSSGGVNSYYLNSASIGITNNAWHHIVATYDGSNKKIYVDGVERGSMAYSVTLRTGQQGQIIGAYGGTGAHSYWFNGNIDEVRVWNYGRLLTDIQENMNKPLNGNESGLIGYWNFNDQTADDLSPNGNNGTFYGNATINPGGPFPQHLYSIPFITDTVPSGDSTVVNVFIN
ncbi:MAG: LamG-like jellyroll fold domain-containing protein, partial [Bacteroidota bacterium]